jgi:hypothetical protein
MMPIPTDCADATTEAFIFGGAVGLVIGIFLMWLLAGCPSFDRKNEERKP